VVKIKSKYIALTLKVLTVLLIIFGLFLVYQILRIITGGSWSVEDIITSLLFFNLGTVFTIGLMLATLSSDVRHLSRRFDHLAIDFKELTNNFKEHVKKHK